MSAGEAPRSPASLHGSPAPEPHGLLPPWPAVLAVVAHPDDESFGLGAIIDKMTSAGATVHVLCYTRGEASTLNQAGAGLIRQRTRELRQAGAALPGLEAARASHFRTGRLAWLGRPPAGLSSAFDTKTSRRPELHGTNARSSHSAPPADCAEMCA